MNITILIPSFNSADTVGPTLESIQAQEIELAHISAVYLADDCSHDHTIAVAQTAWKAPIPLCILKGERNLGERENVNRAIAVIKENADWVLILHSDDIAKPNWLQMMVSRIEACSESIGSICSSWDTLLPDGSVILGEDDSSRPIEVIEGKGQAVRGTLLRGCWWHVSGCALRIRAFEDVGGFNSQLPQMGDWDWLLRCLSNRWSVEYIPRTLISYRQHGTSVSAKSFQKDRDVEESLIIVQQFVRMLSKSDLLYFHLRRGSFVIRRIARALIQFRVHRCLRASGTLMSVGSNFLRCMQKQLHNER